MATKMTKRELQSPDKFQKQAGGWFDWAHENQKQVALGAAGLLVVILAIGLIFGGKSTKAPVSSEAGRELSAALTLVERPVASGAPEGAEKPFATEKEKQQAIADALTEVRRKHPGTSAAISAILPLADAQFKLGAYDQAVALYDEYLQKAPANSPLRFLALEGRAQGLEAQGKLDDAAKAFDKLGSEAPGYEDRALFGKASVLQQQGKWDEARATYEKLEKEYGTSPLARMAGERLVELNRDHPPAQAAAPEAGE